MAVTGALRTRGKTRAGGKEVMGGVKDEQMAHGKIKKKQRDRERLCYALKLKIFAV